MNQWVEQTQNIKNMFTIAKIEQDMQNKTKLQMEDQKSYKAIVLPS